MGRLSRPAFHQDDDRPVSDVGEFKGKVAALDAGGSSGLS
jgi:hypothetical protein